MLVKLLIYWFNTNPRPRGFVGIGATTGEARHDAVKQIIARCAQLQEPFIPTHIIPGLQHLQSDDEAIAVRNDWLAGSRQTLPPRPVPEGNALPHPGLTPPTSTRTPAPRMNRGKNHRGQAALSGNSQDQRAPVRQGGEALLQEVEAGA